MNGSRYKAMLFVGCVLGVYVGAWVARDAGLSGLRFEVVAIALLIPAFVGARLWYVVRHLDAYRADPRRIVRRSEGGSALYGGLVLSVIISVPVLALAGVPFWAFWDAASITMLVGLALTRFGCLMNGCCAGRETAGRLGLRLPNIRGEWRRRYPTQLFESAWAIVLLAVALVARNAMPFTGALFVGVVASYSAGRVVLEAMREEGRVQRIPIFDL